MRVVTDMVEGGLAPDEATYAGVLHACQRANEAELAFDVLRCLSNPVRSPSSTFVVHATQCPTWTPVRSPPPSG